MRKNVQYEQLNTSWCLDIQYIENVKQLLHKVSQDSKQFPQLIPEETANDIISEGTKIFKSEPTLLELSPNSDINEEVVVVGDTHGQVHDVLHMLSLVGQPCQNKTYVFNGDYVDRGSWGLELLLLLLIMKISQPRHVYILRGNHECTTCTRIYGFRQEVLHKYGRKVGMAVYNKICTMFRELPLGACIARTVLVVHGGLFRAPPTPASKLSRIKWPGKRKRSYGGGKAKSKMEVGTLDDLRNATKGGKDPQGTGRTQIVCDTLWSDPCPEQGLFSNDCRGIGIIFGPDITEQFLSRDHLQLIIRSHEGPDSRDLRDGLSSLQQGYAIDHQTQAGNLVTVFSAPDYPQHQSSVYRQNNAGAVAVLKQPTYTIPHFISYHAVPRPNSEAFYDFQTVPGSDEELPSCSDTSSIGDASSIGDESQYTVDDDTCQELGRGSGGDVQGVNVSGGDKGGAQADADVACQQGGKIEGGGVEVGSPGGGQRSYAEAVREGMASDKTIDSTMNDSTMNVSTSCTVTIAGNERSSVNDSTTVGAGVNDSTNVGAGVNDSTNINTGVSGSSVADIGQCGTQPTSGGSQCAGNNSSAALNGSDGSGVGGASDGTDVIKVVSGSGGTQEGCLGEVEVPGGSADGNIGGTAQHAGVGTSKASANASGLKDDNGAGGSSNGIVSNIEGNGQSGQVNGGGGGSGKDACSGGAGLVDTGKGGVLTNGAARGSDGVINDGVSSTMEGVVTQGDSQHINRDSQHIV